MEIAPDGIVWATDGSGRVTGEAYVRFLDKETTERALDKHMQNIGHRWGSFGIHIYIFVRVEPVLNNFTGLVVIVSIRRRGSFFLRKFGGKK